MVFIHGSLGPPPELLSDEATWFFSMPPPMASLLPPGENGKSPFDLVKASEGRLLFWGYSVAAPLQEVWRSDAEGAINAGGYTLGDSVLAWLEKADAPDMFQLEGRLPWVKQIPMSIWSLQRYSYDMFRFRVIALNLGIVPWKSAGEIWSKPTYLILSSPDDEWEYLGTFVPPKPN